MDDQADLELHLCATSALTSRCPLCQETANPKIFPFCSKRCAMLDLGRWMRGEYTLEGHGAAESDALLNDESQGEVRDDPDWEES